MPSGLTKKLLIALMLGSLTTSAFFIRLENFKNTPARSIDEVVYARMAKQVLEEGLTGYNTIPYAKELAEQGRPLPNYFFQPVFKYPPLFTLLIAQSMNIFGSTPVAVAYVPLLAGVLLIPLTYLLGVLIANRFVGALAAFLMFMDPVAIICSQKIWPETTLALFTLLSVASFIKALKSGDRRYFLVSGLLCGLAANVKYPGILVAPIGLIFAYFHRGDLLRNKTFLAGALLPFLMLFPWVLWNWVTYQENFFNIQVGLHSFGIQKEVMLSRITKLGILGIILMILNFYRKKPGAVRSLTAAIFSKRIATLFLKALVILIIIAESDSVWRAFQINTLPLSGWSAGIFTNEWASFYFGRLVEFSPLYLFGFASFLFFRKDLSPGARFLQYATLGTLFFYVLWGNYQSRYILTCIPFFLALTAYFIFLLTQKITAIPQPLYRNILFFIMAGGILYALVKTGMINQRLSFPNDLCYF